MNIAIARAVQSPSQVFSAASTQYKAAIDTITFAPNERVDVRAAVGIAISQANDAVALLTPFTAEGNMFTKRNASASIRSAQTAMTALNNARATFDVNGPVVPASVFLEIAQNQLKSAEGALWWE